MKKLVIQKTQIILPEYPLILMVQNIGIEIQIITAFIHGESGGNTAGVVLDADEFSAI